MENLDPTAQTLTQAIAMQEGGGKLLPYTAPSGDMPNAPTGTAGGRYQFTAPTWQNYAGQVLGNPNAPMTPENQNQVAYTKIKSWLDSGKTPAEAASMWNAGEGAPDAWKPGTVQKVGNTPQYVRNVQKYAQQLSGGMQQAPSQTDVGANISGYTPPTPPGQQSPQQSGSVNGYAPPTPPPPSTSTGTPAAPENLWQKAGDVTSGIGNFLFPAVGDVSNLIQGKNTKTPLQIAGDVGLSALPFIPGLGEVADTARAGEAVAEGGGLLSKLAGLPVAVKGAGVGYGAGVAANLSQGQELGQAFMPNAANIGGALTGGIASAVIPKLLAPITRNFTESGAIDATINSLTDELKRTAPGKRLLSSLPGQGANEIRLMATGGMTPDVVGTNFDVANARSVAQSRIAALGQLRAQALDTLGTQHSLDEIAQEAIAKAGASPLTPEAEAALSPSTKSGLLRQQLSGTAGDTAAQIQSIVDNIKATTGKDFLSTSELEALKEVQAGLSKKYARAGQIGAADARSFLADTARGKIEKTAKESGLPNIRDLNSYIQSHYNIQKILSRLESQKVKGGMLGNMLRSRTGDILGGVVGNTVAPGVGGTLIGALAGEGGANLVSKIIGDSSLSNPIRDALIANIERQDPAIVQQFMAHAGQVGDVAPIAVPKTTKAAGLIGNLMTKAAIRGGASI